MKRIFMILVMCVMFFTACDSAQEQTYSIKVASHLETDIFKESTPVWDLMSFVTTEITTSENETVQLGKKLISAKKVEIEEFAYKETVDIFHSEDATMKIRLLRDTKNFLIYSTEDTYLMKYPEKELTEETLINMAKEYISEYIQDVNYDNYIYECETALIKSGEKGAWKENIPMFYHSNKADEKIWEYDLNYREYCNGLATGNLISVDFDGAGNIVRLGYYDYDVDWSSVSADQSIVKESITDFLNKYVRTKYQISGYEIRSQALTCIEGKVCLSLGVGVSFLYNNDEYEMLIPLILEI